MTKGVNNPGFMWFLWFEKFGPGNCLNVNCLLVEGKESRRPQVSKEVTEFRPCPQGPIPKNSLGIKTEIMRASEMPNSKGTRLQGPTGCLMTGGLATASSFGSRSMHRLCRVELGTSADTAFVHCPCRVRSHVSNHLYLRQSF